MKEEEQEEQRKQEFPPGRLASLRNVEIVTQTNSSFINTSNLSELLERDMLSRKGQEESKSSKKHSSSFILSA